MKLLRALALLPLCLLAACASPWGGDVACLSVASYAERIECQSKVKRSITGDEDLRRKTDRTTSGSKQSDSAADPLCYVKAGEGEKPCAK